MRLAPHAPWVASCCLLAFVGCGDDGGRIKVYPVTGKVLVNGQPAEGANVAFFGSTPELQGPAAIVPTGTSNAEGVFELTSFDPGDGAPEGTFNVTVIWPEPIPPNVDQEMYQPKDRLNGRYANPDTPNLTARVEQGGGELPPFELQ